MQIYAGLDVHRQFTYGTVMDEEGNVVFENKVLTSLSGFKSFFKRLDGQDVTAVFEASGNWRFVSDLLSQTGVKRIMAHPLRVRAIASARIKTDKIDSRVLAHLLRSDLIPRSYMPPDEIVELRELARFRASLGRDSAKLKCRIRGILAKNGLICPFSDVDSNKSKVWLKNCHILDEYKGSLEFHMGSLERIKEEIKRVEVQLSKEVVRYPDAKLIMSIPGFAEYSALLVLGEIGDIHRFETPEKLAAYAGLVSSTYQSGNTLRHGSITKQGSKVLRWILVQSALNTIRKENRIRRFYLRIKQRRGHQVAIVASARKLLTIIWKMLKDQQEFHA